MRFKWCLPQCYQLRDANKALNMRLEVAQAVKCLLHEDLQSSHLKKKKRVQWLGVVAQAFNSSIWEAETGGSRTAWSTQLHSRQPDRPYPVKRPVSVHHIVGKWRLEDPYSPLVSQSSLLDELHSKEKLLPKANKALRWLILEKPQSPPHQLPNMHTQYITHTIYHTHNISHTHYIQCLPWLTVVAQTCNFSSYLEVWGRRIVAD